MVEPIKPRKEQSDFYSVNPFEDCNMKDGGVILAECCWNPCGETNLFIYYTRPGKTNGISASFNTAKTYITSGESNSDAYSDATATIFIYKIMKQDGEIEGISINTLSEIPNAKLLRTEFYSVVAANLEGCVSVSIGDLLDY